MKKQIIIRQILAVALCLGLSFGMFDGIPFVKESLSGEETAEALCANGIQGNGLGGISININSGYYASYANIPTYGQYAYTTSGCAWFASARVRELTGKGTTIYGGSNWYNTEGPNLGFTRGSALKAKAVACWSNHVAIVEAISGNTIYISEGGYTPGTAANGYTVIRTVSSSYFSSGSRGNWLGFVYLGVGGTVASADNIPQGCVDYAACTAPGKITVRGWAFDKDNTGVSIDVHVYIGDEGHAITANKSRPDVNTAYPGVGNYHGFEAVIDTKKSGNQSVVIYAINIGKDGKLFGNGNSNPSIGKKTILITTDTTKPTISNIIVSDITRGYYTVTATATDNIGVKEVRFATWSSKNGQDDLKWVSGTKAGNNTWKCQILASDHNMESGEYITHIYAYDTAGNSQGKAAPTIRIPDVTENTNINTDTRFEARISNTGTGYYFYPSEKTIIDAGHWDLLSGKYTDSDSKELQKRTWTFSRQSDGYYTIQNKYSGKYLDVAYSSKNPGANVILSDLNAEGKNDNQKFRLYKASKGYFITSKCTPYTVLDINNHISGTSVSMGYYASGNADQVFNILKSGETANQSGKYGISNPRTDKNGVTTWDCIWFGNYWQSSKTTKDPIKWRVLSVNGDDAFLLADQNLDWQSYHTKLTDVTWATCSLRTWLNSTFYQNAFSSAEQLAIRTTTVVNGNNPFFGTEGGKNTQDKVYLLSIAEASSTAYGFNAAFGKNTKTRVAVNTAYAASRYIDLAGSAGGWWLRSPGYYSINATGVDVNGYGINDGYGVIDDTGAVRPALHINLSSNTWKKAGTICAEGGTTQNGKTTITVPGMVKSLKAKNKKKKSVLLTWKKVSGAKGYQIQYALNKKFKKKKSRVTKKRKCTVKNLRKKTYYVRVRAYKLNEKKKVYGKWSKVKKIKIRK